MVVLREFYDYIRCYDYTALGAATNCGQNIFCNTPPILGVSASRLDDTCHHPQPVAARPLADHEDRDVDLAHPVGERSRQVIREERDETTEPLRECSLLRRVVVSLGRRRAEELGDGLRLDGRVLCRPEVV